MWDTEKKKIYVIFFTLKNNLTPKFYHLMNILIVVLYTYNKYYYLNATN